MGDVGNKGTLTQVPSLISKTPQLHSLDLENVTASQLAGLESFRQNFHFSCLNYGDYYLFFYILHYFPHPAAQSTWQFKIGLLLWRESSRDAEDDQAAAVRR